MRHILLLFIYFKPFFRSWQVLLIVHRACIRMHDLFLRLHVVRQHVISQYIITSVVILKIVQKIFSKIHKYIYHWRAWITHPDIKPPELHLMLLPFPSPPMAWDGRGFFRRSNRSVIVGNRSVIFRSPVPNLNTRPFSISSNKFCFKL